MAGLLARRIGHHLTERVLDVATVVLTIWPRSREGDGLFFAIVHQGTVDELTARAVTHERVSVGGVERGEPGRHEAMPYFWAVLRDLVSQHVEHHASTGQ